MKIKLVFLAFSFLSILVFISCDDDLNSIGKTVQPPTDTIASFTDTIAIKARTVSMSDSIYARTSQGILGQYKDDIFGSIKSDYLCQLYFPDDFKFNNDFKSIDSVKFIVYFSDYAGDTKSPMGLKAYKVTKPLTENFYTNVDPSKYYDATKILVNEAYTINSSDVSSITGTRRITTKFLDNTFGEDLRQGIKSGKIYNDKSFNDFFKGMYVTTDFGSGNLINVTSTAINIYYSHTYTDSQNKVRDTTAIATLASTPEVIQLNHIKNKNPDYLFTENTGATYLKTPAGVYTELTIPVSEITKNMKQHKMQIINTASFIINGYTEKEPDPTSNGILKRPDRLLLIDKDSVASFFTKKQLPNGTTSILSQLKSSTDNNTYSFDNISKLIKHYQKLKKNTPVFVVIPVTPTYVQVNINGSTALNLVGVYNSMQPTGAILRSDSANMNLKLIYSKF